jgi:hypothetical protein
MTNTGQMTINQETAREGIQAMNGYVETNQVVIRARISELQAEAAGERLAATSRSTTGSGMVRRHVGRLLIQAGQRVAGGQASAGSPAAPPARPSPPMAA